VLGVCVGESDGSEIRERLKGACDEFLELGARTDREVAQELREREVDIAVDLMGYTRGSRSSVFAYRVAPVQVNYLGYPGSLGAEYVDYIVADAEVIPPGQEGHYQEQVVRLPGSYFPADESRPLPDTNTTRTAQGLPEEGLVLCCFNGHYKLNPPVFGMWMKLLRAIPNAVLWVQGGNESAEANLRAVASAQGVQERRLIFATPVKTLQEHLSRQALADLFLDTLPYNAHTTARDALWAGVPVITCRGGSFASRVGASLLQAVGLPELITDSLSEYEQKVLELSAHPQQRKALREHLLTHRHHHPLFDSARYTRQLESAFITMHQRAQQALPPVAFDIT